MTADPRTSSAFRGSPRARYWLIAILGLAATAAAVTADADFLAHPGWLAAQKADLILSPVLIGLERATP